MPTHKNHNCNSIEYEELLEHLNDINPDHPDWQHRRHMVMAIRYGKSKDVDVVVLRN